MFTTLKRILSIRREPVKPVIDVVVTSNDLFWDQITEDLQKNGYSVTSNAKKILFDVFPQAGTSYRLVIVKVPGEKISYSKARRFGKKCGYKLLPIEVASLLAKAVSGVELKAHGIPVGWVYEQTYRRAFSRPNISFRSQFRRKLVVRSSGSFLVVI